MPTHKKSISDPFRRIGPGQHIPFLFDYLPSDVTMRTLMSGPKFGEVAFNKNKMLYFADKGLKYPVSDRFYVAWGDDFLDIVTVAVDPDIVYPQWVQDQMREDFVSGPTPPLTAIPSISHELLRIEEALDDIRDKMGMAHD